MNIRDQIAAARALRDEWVHPDNPSYGGCIELIEVEMGWLLESLERACELLAVCEGWISADTEDASHFVELAQVRAFLAGEVTKP